MQILALTIVLRVAAVGKERPRTRDATSPGANESNEKRVKGKKDKTYKTTWADVVKRHTHEAKIGILDKVDPVS